MTTGAVAYARSAYRRFFPERQIYHRCNGQVQFTTVSARAQIIAIMLVAGSLGWLAFASVNVIFTEQINQRMAADLRDSKRRWEAKLAEMQGDYERLHAAVAVVEDQLETSLQELEERQKQVDAVFDRQVAVLSERAQADQVMAEAVFSPPEGNANTSVSVLNMKDPDPTPRRSRRMLDPSDTTVEGLSDVLRSVPAARDHASILEKRVEDFEDLEERVMRIQTTQYDRLVELEELTTDEIDQYEGALKHTSLDLSRLIDTFKDAERSQVVTGDGLGGQGGPFIGITGDNWIAEDVEQHIFARKTFRIHQKLQHLASLKDTLNALPVTRPVNAYRITDGFGPRPDPFTGRLAMHYGLDIAGRRGTPVLAPASGTIVKSGKAGGYGNMVKIDHGHGFMTLFGHLNSRTVKKGQKVSRGEQIGTLGSTGRSTAPHLHYEILHQGKALDPIKFLEAGRYVFENER